MVPVGLRCALILACLVAAGAGANASLVEQATGGAAAYQFDGDTHHDAPDGCQDADAAWNLPANGTAIDGILVPADDLSDVYVLDVPRDLVGERLHVSIREATGTPDLGITAYVPGCLSDIFAPANQPSPHPAPPAPADGDVQASLPEGAQPWRCEDDAWVFVVSGAPDAPAAIHAAWTDGTERTVAKSGQHRDVAWYTSTDSLGVLVKGAWANLPATWRGQFVLGLGDCDAQDGGAVYGDPAMAIGDRLAFTPIRSGRHLVQVTFSGEAPVVPTSMTLSCHFCTDDAEEAAKRISYRMSASQE